MKRLWTAFLTSVLAATPALAQVSSPAPRPLTPTPLNAAPSTATPTPGWNPPAPQGGMPTQNGPIVEESGASCGRNGCGNLGRGGAGCSSCGNVFGEGCGCDPRCRIWGSVDYLFWFPRGDSTPPLVTTSPAGTPQAAAGVLGQPGTVVAFGGTINDTVRSGIRLEMGVWFDPSQALGLQIGAIFLGDSRAGRISGSNGSDIIARPFFDAAAGAQASQLVSFPGVVGGTVDPSEITAFDGFDIALRSNTCCGPCWRIDSLIGYRYLRLADKLSITENLTALTPFAIAPGNVIPAGTAITVSDRFEATNTFHGAEVGIAGEFRFRERWTVEGNAKASFGYLNQRVDINGTTTFLPPGAAAPTVGVGGLLALITNAGPHTHSEGQIVPEINLNLAYDISSTIRARIGYSFLYMNNVYRGGSVIDTSINPFYVPPIGALGAANPLRPVLPDQRTDFYLHGLNAGLEIRF